MKTRVLLSFLLVTLCPGVSGAVMPLDRAATYETLPLELPVVNSDPAKASPLGVGALALGGSTFNIRIGFDQISVPVDIYLALYAPSLTQEIFLIGPDRSFHPASAGLIAWRTRVATGIDDSLWGDVPASALPEGEYHFFVLVVPSGQAGSPPQYALFHTPILISKVEPFRIRVHAIVQDLKEFNEADIRNMLAGAHPVYWNPFGNVVFELGSLEVSADPLLMQDHYMQDEYREAIAVRYPGRLVVIFGNGENYSSGWGHFVKMGNYKDTRLGSMRFAHEAGHYLNLQHTHTGTIDTLAYKNDKEGAAAARQYAIEQIRLHGLEVFEGDATPLPGWEEPNRTVPVRDTPPDPGPPLFQESWGAGYTGTTPKIPDEECLGAGSLLLQVDGNPVVLAPDRTNIMSYFHHCPNFRMRLSYDQSLRVREALFRGNRRHLADGAYPEGVAAVRTMSGAIENIHVFARGDDWNIRNLFWSGYGWSGWRSDLGSGTFTSGPGAVVYSDGNIHVFAGGDDRNIWHNFWNGNRWSGWIPDLKPGIFTSAPTAVVTPDGAIHVFARGTEKNIRHCFWKGNAWSDWSDDLGVVTAMSGPSVVLTGDHIHAFVQGPDRRVWHSFWNGSQWSGWRPDLSDGTITSAPSAVVTTYGTAQHIHIFARGDDRNIWHSFWDGNAWSGWSSELGSGRFRSGPSAVVTSSNNIHVFAISDERTIADSLWNGSSWSGWHADFAAGTLQP